MLYYPWVTPLIPLSEAQVVGWVVMQAFSKHMLRLAHTSTAHSSLNVNVCTESPCDIVTTLNVVTLPDKTAEGVLVKVLLCWAGEAGTVTEVLEPCT